MAPTKQISTSVGFQDPKGTVVANGMLMLQLSQACTVTASGGIVTTDPIYLNLDSSGKITATAIWFNDELSPSGTIYYGTVYFSNKTRMVPGLEKLQYSITGASFDIATSLQSGSASPSFAGAVMLNPTAQQNINGQTLNMEGASLSFSAAASTTADSFFSRLSAGVIAVGTAIGNALGTIRAAIFQGQTLTLTTASNTLPATITNDTGGGINVTTNGSKTWEFANGGSFSSPAGSGVQFNGGTSGATSVVASAIAGSNVLTLPAATDTLVGKATTDILTNKTLSSPIQGFTTVGNGVAVEVAVVDLTAQGANIGATTALTTPSAGMYRLSIYIITTRVATVSSTQPNVVIQWTDRDNTTGQSSTVISSDSSNTLTNARSVTFSISCSASTTIQYSTTGYATSGATSSQYALRFKIEAL